MRLRFKPIAQDAAIAVLNRLLAGYRRGLCEPLPLAANTAWAWVSHEDKDEALKKARAAFNPGFTMPGEGDDPYIARAWPDFDSISVPLQALSEQLFGDLPDYLETED